MVNGNGSTKLHLTKLTPDEIDEIAPDELDEIELHLTKIDNS